MQQDSIPPIENNDAFQYAPGWAFGAGISGAICLLLLAIALFYSGRAWYFTSRSVETIGEVIGTTETSGDVLTPPIQHHFFSRQPKGFTRVEGDSLPKIRFRTSTGHTVEYIDYGSRAMPGCQITVLSEPRPETAERLSLQPGVRGIHVGKAVHQEDLEKLVDVTENTELCIGERVRVLYDPANPESAKISSPYIWKNAKTSFTWAGVFGFLWAGFRFYGWRKSAKS